MSLLRQNLFTAGKPFFERQLNRCESQTVCQIILAIDTVHTADRKAFNLNGQQKIFVFTGVNDPGSTICCRLRHPPFGGPICVQAIHAEVVACRKMHVFLQKNFERTRLADEKYQAYLTFRMTRKPCDNCWKEMDTLLDWMRENFAHPPRYTFTLADK